MTKNAARLNAKEEDERREALAVIAGDLGLDASRRSSSSLAFNRAASAAPRKIVINGPTVETEPLAKQMSYDPPAACGSTPSTSFHGSRPHSSDFWLYQ